MIGRRSFFRGLLGAAAVPAVTLAAAPVDTDSVKHIGAWTLTWEGWQRRVDVWALFGYWRATRDGTDHFLYSTTGGIVGSAGAGYALNLVTREGWLFLTPDSPVADLEAARIRALGQLIVGVREADMLRPGDYR